MIFYCEAKDEQLSVQIYYYGKFSHVGSYHERHSGSLDRKREPYHAASRAFRAKSADNFAGCHFRYARSREPMIQ
jgi:hypothetical protein